MNKRLGRYGNYPRRPNTDLDRYDDSSKPYVPKVNKGVIKEKTITLPGNKGNTLTIGNAPNVNYLKKQYYGV